MRWRGSNPASRFPDQSGFWIGPAIGALVIVLILASGSSGLIRYAADTLRVNSSASQLEAMSTAAAHYVENNYGTLTTTLTLNGAAVSVTPVMMQADGDLDSSYSATNAYGQSYLLQLRYVSQGSGSNIRNVIEPMLCTMGGTQLPDRVALRIASKVDAGGTVLSSSPKIANGNNGQWSQAVANFGIAPGAGHVCVGLFANDAGMIADYLYRNAVPGHPEVNRMNTAIDMNNNAINNASTITALGKITAGGNVEVGSYLQLDGTAVEGAACSTNGLVAQNGAGLILSCQSGAWEREGGVVRFGGTYAINNADVCVFPNPATGGCWCPGGYSYAGITIDPYQTLVTCQQM